MVSETLLETNTTINYDKRSKSRGALNQKSFRGAKPGTDVKLISGASWGQTLSQAQGQAGGRC